MKRYIWFNPLNKVGGTNGGKWWDKERVELTRADIPHTCQECGLKILPGDLYYMDTFTKRNHWGLKPIAVNHEVCPYCWKGVDMLNQYKQDRLLELQVEQGRLESLVAEVLKREGC